MIQVIAVHLEGGEHLQHITYLRVVQVSQPGAPAAAQSSDETKADVVAFVRQNPRQVFAMNSSGSTYAFLEVVDAAVPYVRTMPDSTTTDNLLSLPRF